MFYNQRINSFEHPLICQQVNQDEFLKELPISLCSGFANYNNGGGGGRGKRCNCEAFLGILNL